MQGHGLPGCGKYPELDCVRGVVHGTVLTVSLLSVHNNSVAARFFRCLHGIGWGSLAVTPGVLVDTVC